MTVNGWFATVSGLIVLLPPTTSIALALRARKEQAMAYVQSEFRERVKHRAQEVLMDAGFERETRDGIRVVDSESLKEAVYDIVVAKEATSIDNYTDEECSVTPAELLQQVAPSCPGANGKTQRLDEEDLAVHDDVQRRLWQMTAPGAKGGTIQTMLRDRGESLILCRAPISRGVNPTGEGAFVTNDAELILMFSLGPEVQGMIARATRTGTHAKMILARHPELTTEVLARLTKGVADVRRELPMPGKASGNGRSTERELEAPAGDGS